MLSVVVPAMRATDPQVKVFLGGLAYDWFTTDNGGPFNQHFLADVLTTGNHVWDKREIVDYFQMVEGNGHGPARRVLRPANYPASSDLASR